MQEVEYNYSAGGFVIEDGKVLVITSPSTGDITPPKGTIDPGETIEETAVRELKEETGYDVEIIEQLGEYSYEFDWKDGKHHVKTVTFFLMKRANELPPKPSLQPGEDFIVKWLPIDEARQRFTYDEAREALEIALTRLNET